MASSSSMDEREATQLTDGELQALFDRLFSRGFAGADVCAELAPQGWERSPLLACFHPSAERILEECLSMHRNIEALHHAVTRRGKVRPHGTAPAPEPTLEAIQREYTPTPVNRHDEMTELVGSCLWDIFSDNHDVIVADGRVAHIGSFRGASAFLDDYLSEHRGTHRAGDHMRFYMGTLWISDRADLAPVYAMIFRRLEALGADWVYHFPEIGLVEFESVDADADRSNRYSVAAAAAAELNARQRRDEVEHLRATLAEANVRAREDAMDRPPSPIVRAYRKVYGQDPRGWPPA
jgi:hypothetical protein